MPEERKQLAEEKAIGDLWTSLGKKYNSKSKANNVKCNEMLYKGNL